jgi:hypothetical protein
MTRLRSVFAAVTVAVLASVSLAAEPPGPFSGTWVGVVNLQHNMKLPFVAHLKQDGDSVSGVLDGINGASDVPIQGGMISNGTLTFTGVRVINNQNVTFTYTVTRTSGGGLHFAIARQGGGRALESMTRRLTVVP